MVITMEKISINFLSIKTCEDLNAVLKLKGKQLNYFISDGVCDKNYKSFSIKKKNGGERVIEAPCKQLKYIQKTLSEILQDIYTPKKSVHGYVKKRSIITNSDVHVNKKIIINIDIKDFFCAIHFGRVMGMFQKEPFNFSREIAKILARLVCYSGRLPQGAPSSPIISNFIARGLDNDLIKLTSHNKLLYTRYCDDITISSKSNNVPTNILTSEGKLGKDIENIFAKNSFIINPNKTSVKFQKNRQMVTGLVVNQKVNILNKKYRKTRSVFYYTLLNGIEAGAVKNNFIKSDGSADNVKFLQFLKGTTEFYKMVLGVYSSKYQLIANYYNTIVEKPVFSIPENFDTMINNYVFVIESPIGQGTGFFVKNIGLVTCLHNFWKISDAIREDELKRKISQSCAFLPIHERKKYSLTLLKYCFNEDLILLKIEYFNSQNGFEISSDLIMRNYKNEIFTAVGFPGYAGSKDISIVKKIMVSQKRKWLNQELFIVDKTFYCGASGGPIFNKNKQVVGVIDRGNEYGEKEENYNAFTSINPIID